MHDPDEQAELATASSTAVRILVGRETKGRRGAGVTTVNGLQVTDEQLAELARGLKRACATGGTVRGCVIELQGDHRDAVVGELRRRGWDAKRAGG